MAINTTILVDFKILVLNTKTKLFWHSVFKSNFPHLNADAEIMASDNNAMNIISLDLKRFHGLFKVNEISKSEK